MLESRRAAGVGERLIPPDCKSGAFGLRGFESLPLHQLDLDPTDMPT